MRLHHTIITFGLWSTVALASACGDSDDSSSGNLGGSGGASAGQGGAAGTSGAGGGTGGTTGGQAGASGGSAGTIGGSGGAGASGGSASLPYSDSWLEFRATKVRKWHAELAWENVPGATGYALQYQTFGDNAGYVEPRTVGGWKNITETTTPAAKITGNTAIVYNMATNTRHRLRVRAIGATNADYGNWSYGLPVRTGLFPKEVDYTKQDVPFRPRPPAGDFTPFDGEFGTEERRVSDIVRDANDRRAMIPYPKVQRTYQYTDGTGFIRGHSTGQGLLKWDLDTYQPIDVPAGYVGEFPALIPTPPGTIKTWRPGASSDPAERRRFYELINGKRRLLYDAEPHEGRDGNTSVTRSGENKMSWDEHYISFEIYKNGNYQDAWGVVFDMQSEQVVSEWNSGIDIQEGQITMSASGKFVTYDSSSDGDDGYQYVVRNNDATQSDPGLPNFEHELAGTSGPGGSGHGDMCQTIQGNDAWVGRRGGRVMMHVFEGPNAGKTIDMIAGVERNAEIGHISCQAYLHEGWAIMNNVVRSDCVDCGELGHFKNKIWAIQLDESAESRGESALMRVYARVHRQLPSASGNFIRSVHVDPTRDLTKVFYNNYITPEGSTDAGEIWVAQQKQEHGDELTPGTSL